MNHHLRNLLEFLAFVAVTTLIWIAVPAQSATVEQRQPHATSPGSRPAGQAGWPLRVRVEAVPGRDGRSAVAVVDHDAAQHDTERSRSTSLEMRDNRI